MNIDLGAAPGKGVDGSNHFGVLYFSSYNPPVITLEEPAVIAGTYVTNNLYTYNSLINGDGFSGGPFEQGDFLKVRFTVYDDTAEGATPSVEVYLADYRSENAEEHSIITDWEWIDLSSLGEVQALTLSFEGSRSNQWGLLTPAYLCLDNVGASDPGEGNNIAHPHPISARSVIRSHNGILSVYTSLNEYDIHIYSITGDLIYKGNSGSSEINTSTWPQGMYMAEIISGNGRETHKFIR